MQRRALMTELATQALDLSDTFNVMFEGKFVSYQLDLAKPGMSTAGGKHAVQHIALHAQNGGSLVIGSVDTPAKRAELRSHARVANMHRQRFGTDLTITRGEWGDFLDRAERFLRDEGLDVEREPEPAGASPADFGVPAGETRMARGVPVWLAIVLAVVLAAIAVTVTLLLLDRSPPMPVGPVAPPVPGVPAGAVPVPGG